MPTPSRLMFVSIEKVVVLSCSVLTNDGPADSRLMTIKQNLVGQVGYHSRYSMLYVFRMGSL
jgi:hypothetical protein